MRDYSKRNQFGTRNPFYGKHHTEETKQKIKEKRLGKHHSEETKRLYSQMRSGEKNPMFGRTHTKQVRNRLRNFHFGLHPSEETRKKMGDKRRGKKHTQEAKEKIRLNSIKNWKTEEIATKMMFAMQIKPNAKELYLDSLLQNNFPDEWKFVGDGQIIIDGLCPDFINVANNKQIIEVFGDYWHNNKNTKYYQTEQGRKEIFEKHGYSTLIIWEHELSNENKVIEKIKLFFG